jgi:hypothetical protein
MIVNWKELALPKFSYHHGICLEGLRKPMKSVNHVGWHDAQYLNEAHPKYRSECYPLGQLALIQNGLYKWFLILLWRSWYTWDIDVFVFFLHYVQ